MSNDLAWKTRAEHEHEIVRLLRRGFSQRQIARAMGVTRGLVKRVLEGLGRIAAPHTALPSTTAPSMATPRPSKLDGYEARAEELLAQFPSITAQRVYEELRVSGRWVDLAIWRSWTGSLDRHRGDLGHASAVDRLATHAAARLGITAGRH